MKATFLEAAVPLTKTFAMKDDQIDKIGHPRIIDYTSHLVEFSTIEELHRAMLQHASKGHCFLKGNVARPLVSESRAGTTNPNELTRVLLLDLDGVKGIRDVAEFLAHLGLADVDYIVQYSSSMGVLPERGMSAHIFVLLDRDAAPAVLKQYLMRWNLTVPILRDHMGLTATYNALRWTLDVTTCQNDKLIYIAPPIVKDGIEDKFEGERIQLVKGTRRTATLVTPMPNAEKNQAMQEEMLNTLRAGMGLDRRPRDAYKSSGPIEYMLKPDRAVVTGVRVDPEFTYLNLNGGDSWAYWHPTNNPEFVRNFKGEPIYRTRDLIPDYWADVKDRIQERQPDANGVIYLAFRDFRTAQYYNGTFDKHSGKLNLAVAKNAAQLKDFLLQHGQPWGDFVPDWDVKFDPHSDVIVDADNRVVNTFQPTIYMRAKHRRVDKMPPVASKIISHATGNDPEVFEHLMNMFACVFQYRERCATAPILHGIPGTGKGLILDRILRPIFGLDYVLTKRMRELDTQFNGYMEKAFFLWVDEAEQEDFKDNGIVNADIKNFITEPRISIRKMYTLPYEVNNYMTWILASNKGHVIQIDPDDRRFVVCVFQGKPLEITDAELRTLDDELMDVAAYWATRTADREKARKPLNNQAKQNMILLNRTTIDTASDAILSGNLEFFWDLMPQGDIESLPRYEQEQAQRYVALVRRLAKEEPASMLREELHLLLDYTVGDMPAKQAKFTSMIKHHKLYIKTVSYKGEPKRGISTKWKVNPEWKRRQ